MVRLDYKNARSDFEQAIVIDPALGEAWVNRGAINIIDRRYKDGVSDISKGLYLGTNEPAKAYYNRGVAYEGMDDEASAYQDYQEATGAAAQLGPPQAGTAALHGHVGSSSSPPSRR